MKLELHIGKFCEKIGQVFEKIQPVCLAGFNDAVGCGAGSSTLGGAAEQPVLTPYGEVPDGAFTDVVGHSSFSVIQVDG